MMTSNPTESSENWQAKLPRWQLLVILVGFPLAYWINSALPWSYGLFVRRDHSNFIPWGLSICGLHWASLCAAIWFLKRAGGRLSDIGLHLRAATIAPFVIAVVVAGGLLIAVRQNAPVHSEPPNDWRFFYPFTTAERCVFLFMALSAGVCEEVVYRGFAIRALQGRGWQTWQAIGLSTLAFILIHGIAALFLFPFLFVASLFYAGLFLWRGSLTAAIWLHTLFDLSALLAI